jgi:capsule polysaccharide export protein KpsE/RkpR
MSGITSTLKDFGLTKLTGKTEGYSYLVILNSRSVKDSIIKQFRLAKDYDIPDTLFSEVLKEFESNLDITNEKEGNYTITIYSKDKKKAAEMANTYLNIANDLSVKVFRGEARISREYLETRINTIDSTLERIGDSLKVYSRSTFLFSPLDQAKSVSSAYAELKAELMQQEIIYDLMKNKFGENDPFTQTQQKLIDKMRVKVNDVENKAGFAGNFPLKDAAKVGMEYLRLYAQYEAFTKVKTVLLPMIEDARLDETRETQALIVLDPAIPADKKASPKRSLIVAGATLGTFFLCILFVLFLNAIKSVKEQYNSVKNS